METDRASAEVAEAIVHALPLGARRMPRALAMNWSTVITRPSPGVSLQSVLGGQIVDIEIMRDGEGLHELTIIGRAAVMFHGGGMSLLDIAEAFSGPGWMRGWTPARPGQSEGGWS